MTEPTYTDASIIVLSRGFGVRAWQLLVSHGWNPPITDGVDPRWTHFQFTNDDFNTSVIIIVIRWTEDSRTEGCLIPTDGPCPLCTDLRHILVREYRGDSSAFAGETLHALLTKGIEAAKRVGIVEMTKPCPACCTPDYLLAEDEHNSEEDF